MKNVATSLGVPLFVVLAALMLSVTRNKNLSVPDSFINFALSLSQHDGHYEPTFAKLESKNLPQGARKRRSCATGTSGFAC